MKKLKKIFISCVFVSCFLQNVCFAINESTNESSPSKISRNDNQTPQSTSVPNSNKGTKKKRTQSNKVSNTKEKESELKKNEKTTTSDSIKKEITPSDTNSTKDTPPELPPTNQNNNVLEENEFEDISKEDENVKRSYVIRGIISMMLVVAGAILLVIVILAGCEKKPKKIDK